MALDHYLDIHVPHDEEISVNVKMAQIFARLHLWLVQQQQSSIGVSFPRLANTPGDVLRIHGNSADLASLHASPWRRHTALWSTLSAVLPAPDTARYVNVRRVQKKSAHNLRKRSIANGRLSAEEAAQRIPDASRQRLTLPFLVVPSSSTGQAHVHIYIQQSQIAEATHGPFNTYGFGQSGATVPWFQ